MKAALLALAGLLASAATGEAAAEAAGRSAVTPVQKVIELMEDMLVKGKEEKHNEQVQFAAYRQFCDDTETQKSRSIKEAAEKIEVLKADIEGNTANVEKLTKEIAEHDNDIAQWTGDMKAATKVREEEKATYDKTHKDYAESLDALARAVAVLKQQAHDRPQASEEEEEEEPAAAAGGAFVQLRALKSLKSLARMPEAMQQRMEAFLQDQDYQPEVAGYEFQSQGVIDMLHKFQDKFAAELTALEKEEAEKKHTYEMMMSDLTAQKKQAEADSESKTESKAKNLQQKAASEADLQDTAAVMQADQKYLDDLTATCEQKATDFQARQELRAEELEAIEKAIEIVSSGAVKGSAEKHLPSMLQRGHSLAQLRAKSQSGTRNFAAKFLAARAQALGSRMLSLVAEKAAGDPFGKVRKMIEDLIARLMEEANEEASHKGWCDAELGKNEKTRTAKSEAVEALRAEIDQLEASISKLAETITELSEAVVLLDEKMKEATELRGEERAKNEEAIEDAQAAQTAVAQALTVLKEFYAKAGEATALLQQPEQPEAPEVFGDEPYRGMGGGSGGVVGMLEVIESDFARVESETKAAEQSSQKEYETFMTDSKVDKESKAKDIEHKTSTKQDQSQAIVSAKADLEGTQKELDAALAYFDKLKPSCVDSGVSYEDRVKRREEEIESLQEALKILNGEDLP